MTETPGDLGGLASLQKKTRPPLPFQKFYPYVAIALASLMAADLASMYVRGLMIPSGQLPARKMIADMPPYKPRSDYNDIIARNIFNSDGLIPDVQIAGEKGGEISGPAHESQLPLTLLGTIVHANPGKSVATVQANGNADKILPYLPNDEIESLATLIKVERKKAFIRNLSSGALEYIQIKDDPAFTFKMKAGSGGGDGIVKTEGENVFSINRSDMQAQMSNLPELLTQAYAVPVMSPTQPGKVEGFRIASVQDGSLFTKLGIKANDVIKAVDGDPIDSAAKAMELYNGLNNKNTLTLQVERGGKNVNLTFNIR